MLNTSSHDLINTPKNKPGEVQHFFLSPLKASLNFKKEKLEISYISTKGFRLIFSKKDQLKAEFSHAISEKIEFSEMKIVETDSTISLYHKNEKLEIKKSNGTISLLKDEQILCKNINYGQIKEDYLFVNMALKEDEDIYGLGESMTPLGRRGYRIDNYNWDQSGYHAESMERYYSSLPFGIVASQAHNPWAFYIDTPYRSIIDGGQRSWESLDIYVHRDDIRTYLFTGDSISQIHEKYMNLTGKPERPPLWSLGYHQCRYSYMSTKEALEVAENLRNKKIPCDSIWFDIDYMDNFRVFTCDKERFSDWKECNETLHDKKFKTVAIVDPGVKADPKGVFPIMDEGTEKGYFLKNNDGSDYVAPVWPGGVKFPDFTREEVRSWWADLHQFYFDNKIDAIWNDMNEPAVLDEGKTIPEEIRCYDRGHYTTQDGIHNVYGQYEALGTIEAYEKYKKGERTFLLTRAASAGMQKWCAKWTGDNKSTWEHLAHSISQIINLGLSGFGFSGADVGGFQGITTPELLTRWIQASVFYPFMRNHSGFDATRQEPYVFEGKSEEICRKAIELRYKLLPYINQEFIKMADTGLPLVRPLFWDYDEKPCYNLDDQFLFGSDLIAAPVVTRGERVRKVYLPKGTWFDFDTGKAFEGERFHLIESPLDKIPLFVKEGAILPLWRNPGQSTQEWDHSQLEINLYPFISRESSSLNYIFDDGATKAYQSEKENSLKVSWSKDSKLSLSSLEGQSMDLGVIYHTADGQCIEKTMSLGESFKF